MKLTTVLIFEHDGQSLEGAIKLRNDVDKYAATLGMEAVGAFTTEGDEGRAMGLRMIMGDDS